MKQRIVEKSVKEHKLRKLILIIAMLFTASYAQSQNPFISYLLPDIGAPGLNTSVEIIAPLDRFDQFGKDGFYMNDINDNTRIVLDRPGDSVNVKISPFVVSWKGRVISVQFFVSPKLAPNHYNWRLIDPQYKIPFHLVVNGKRSNSDTFFIVRPFNFGDKSATPERVLGEGALGVRSKRGAMLVNSMVLADATYYVSRNDCDPYTAGNQAYLPFVLIVESFIKGKGGTAINVSGGVEGGANDLRHAGPGGGGGGGSFYDASFPFDSKLGSSGGNGFVSGGPGGRNRSGMPGTSDAFAAFGESTGSNGFSLNGAAPSPTTAYESSGGATGHPFGTSGESCGMGNNCLHNGGYGGGSGYEQDRPGGSGGYGDRGNSSDATNKNGGHIHGNKMSVPLAGGSGGASGNPNGLIRESGSGGGGGGAARVFAPYILDFDLAANGAVGGNTSNNSRGGHGSGGHVGLQFKLLFDTNYKLSALGGEYGSEAGGSGRIRYDGPGYLDTIIEIPFDNRGFDYRGPSTDTTHYVKKRNITIKGGKYEGNLVRVFLKPEGDVWREIKGIRNRSYEWEVDINLPGSDSIFFFFAMQDVDNPNKTQDYLFEPDYVFSQAAANVIIMDAIPELTQAGPFRDTIVDCCEDEIVEFTFEVENTGRGDLFMLNDIAKFTYGNRGYSLVSPQTSTRLRAKTSQSYTVRYRHKKGTRGLVTDYLEIPTNPDTYGPYVVKFEMWVDTLHLVTLDPIGLVEKDTLFLGKVCRGHDTSGIISIENESSVMVTMRDPILSGDPNFTARIMGRRLLTIGPTPNDTGNILISFDTGNLPPGKYSTKVYVGLEECNCPSVVDSFMAVVEIVETDIAFEGQLDFGNVKIGRTKQQNVYLVNKGSSVARITNLPALTPQFKIISVQPNLPVNLKPGDSLTLLVEFAPLIKGRDSSIINMESLDIKNVSCPGFALDTLRGAGVDVRVQITPDIIDFGVRVHCDVVYDTVRVSNPADNNLPFSITKYWIEGPNASSFTLANQPSTPITLAPGEQFDFFLRFDPEIMPFGIKNAQFIIATDEEKTPFDTVDITGENEDFLIDISLTLPYNIGTVPIGVDSIIPFTMTNRGVNDRAINNIMSDNPGVRVEPLTSYLPGNGGTENYQLIVNLKKSGPATVNLKVVSYQPKCADTLEFQVNVIGIEGIVELPDTLDFGALAPCQTKIDSIKITNTGDAPFALLSAGIEDDNGGYFTMTSVINPPDTLRKNDSRFIKISYSAPEGSDGIHTASAVIKVFEDGEEKYYKVILKGERKSGFLSTPAGLDFQTVILNNPKTLSLTLSNTGSWDIDIVSTQGPFNSAFRMISPRPDGTTLTPPGTAMLDFEFNPQVIGNYRDSVVFILNINSCPDTAYVILEGKGAVGVEMHVELPDTLVPPTLDNFALPVIARFNNNGVILDDTVSMTMTLVFNPALFYPISVEPGFILSRTMNGGLMSLVVQSAQLPVNTPGGIIMTLNGYTMLGDEKSTSIEIDTVLFTNSKAISEYTKKDGALNLIICEEGSDRLLQPKKAMNLSITPNPVSGKFDIQIQALEEGLHKVEIYDLQGAVVYESRIEAKSGSAYEFNLNASSFSSGAYNVILRSPVRTVSRSLFIIK